MQSSRKSDYKSFGMLVASATFLIAVCIPSFGQTVSPSPNPSPSLSPTLSETRTPTPTPGVENKEDSQKTPAQPTPVDYFFPDPPLETTKYSSELFDIRLGLAIFTDYTFVFQDSASRAQVGPQASRFDLRAGRFMLYGQIKFKHPWTYIIARDFNESREGDQRAFEGLDLNFTIPLWKKARVTIGKQKEPFIYEMIGDAANLPQQERVLSPFFTSRNVGVRYLDNYLKDRMSFSVGVYNDWFVSERKLRDSGYQVSARLTGLPIESKDSREFLHLGVGYRYVGADDGKLVFKGRPESNVLDNYVDTGKFTAKHANQLALEALYNQGPFSVLTEYVHAWVASSQNRNPQFDGFYVAGSFVLTGENRPYDKKVGYARRIIPKSRWGAVEVVGRFGYVDLDDTLIKGGKMKTWYTGMNWWMSRQWKFGAGYGLADLDKFNVTGRTQRIFTRVQWIN